MKDPNVPKTVSAEPINRDWSAEERRAHRKRLAKARRRPASAEQLEVELFALETTLRDYLRTGHAPSMGTAIGPYIHAGMMAFKTYLGVSKQKMAHFWGVSPQNFIKYTKGERRLNIDLAFKVAATFDWTPELLLEVQRKHEMQPYNYTVYQDRYQRKNLLQ